METIDPKENWSWGPRFDGVVRPWGQEINGVRQQDVLLLLLKTMCVIFLKPEKH
jgi:hypothetical protein